MTSIGLEGAGACSVRRGGRLAALAALAAALALVGPPAALAQEPVEPRFDFGSFGTEGGQFGRARGIAVNETGAGGVPAGTIYIAEYGNNRVQSLDANGIFIRAWGWDVIAPGQPSDTGTGFEVCEAAAECKAGEPGEGAGQFSGGGAGGGVAVNQETGEVYVIDRFNDRVQQFTASGEFIRAWGGSGEGAGQFGFSTAIAGLGVDEAGDVYVADRGNRRVQKFDSEGNFLRMAGWDVVEEGSNDDTTPPEDEYEVCVPAAGDVCKAGVGGAGEGQFAPQSLCCPNYLAVSSAGDVYVVGRANGTIYRLAPTLEFLEEYEATAGPSEEQPALNALAFDRAAGTLLFAKREVAAIFELDPASGEIIAEYPADAPYTPEGDGEDWVGLAINSASGRFYGTRTIFAGSVRVWDEPLIIPSPQIEAPEFTSWTTATLTGTVDPEGAELSRCEFGYGIAVANETAPCAQSPEEIGAGTEPVPVSAEVTGLTANGAHYAAHRLRAVNAEAQATSPDLPFATPEVVATEPASEVTDAGATLNGSLNPLGQAISECVFEYGPTPAYGQTAPCAQSAAEIGTGEGPVPVSAELTGLAPGSAYHFRLRAANPTDGQATGEDEAFQTLGPVLEESWAEEVGFGEATLRARIDPEGKPTTYRFQYGDQGPCSANPCQSAPLPAGSVGEDSDPHEVSASVEGLVPGRTYHFRVIATNPDAENEGPNLSLTTYELLAHDRCPNEGLRAGPSAGLPDCRAYELVSPPDKGGGDIIVSFSLDREREAAYRQAAPGGDRLTYSSTSAFAGALASEDSNQYLSAREPGDWSTEAISPPRSETVEARKLLLNTFFQAFTPDLCMALAFDLNDPPLDPAGIAGFVNLNLYDNCGAGSPEALTVGAPPASGQIFVPQGRVLSADGRHAVFGAFAALEAEPKPAQENLDAQIYDSVRTAVGRELRTVSVLPGGEADPGTSYVGSGADAPRDANLETALSENGSRVFWTSGAGRLYVRANPAGPLGAEAGECAAATPGEACTTALSAAEATFWTATPDGSKAIYTEAGSLYEVDVEAAIAGEAGASEEVAAGVGGLIGASEDLSRLYFTSTEELAAGATEGEPNVYLREAGGGLRFLASAAGAAGIDADAPIFHRARVSADGLRLAFASRSAALAELAAGYESRDPRSGEATLQVYRYNAAAGGGEGELACLSCNPAGARGGAGPARMSYTPASFADVAAWLPGCEWSNHCKRTLAEGADRVAFNAIDSLVPEDRNGAQDVYQWEAPGTGSCTTADPRYFPANRGCVHLLSTGQSPLDSELLDASASGGDVFFTTASDIDPRDPGSIDVYDARAGGGYPPPAREADPCVGDACQSVPAAPEAPAIGSEGYAGPPAAAPPGRCAKPARRARALAGRAKRLRRAAGRAGREGNRRKARRARGKAKRLARGARKQSKRAKRCRRAARASRRAGR